jgi:hypothetical protein
MREFLRIIDAATGLLFNEEFEDDLSLFML